MPKKKISLFRRLYFYNILVIVLFFTSITIFTAREFKDFYLKQLGADLLSKMRIIEPEIAQMLLTSSQNIDSYCKSRSELVNARITVIAPDGTPLGDSAENPANMDNHADRPEVKEALSGKVSKQMRFSYTLKENLFYIAIPIKSADNLVGVLRFAYPLQAIEKTLGTIYLEFALGGVVITLLAGVGIWLLQRRFGSSLMELQTGAQRFATGDLGFRFSPRRSIEISPLAEAMNKMAENLAITVDELIKSKNEQSAILSCLSEGIIALDTAQRILLINESALTMFDIREHRPEGKLLTEVVRNSEIQKFAENILKSGEASESFITLRKDRDFFLRVRGRTVVNQEGRKIGAVIAFSDITELKRLENIRRDFVANVTHELKTPITSIKGFVETIQNGAFEDKKELNKFISIIARQADRLNSLVDDILTLSRIEKESELKEVHLEILPLKPVIESAVSTNLPKAKEKNIKIEVSFPDKLKAKINERLLEQAISNLIDNAIKYSDEGKEITIKGEESNSDITIQVADEGYGIEAEHIPRLFERFYRVDKSRSRQRGGTGLGLAIVKHIAILHGGKVGVESTPGKGSIFSIFLPKV